MKKIKLGFYPYTYVRANVMRSLLVKREDYHKLLKMGLNDITRFLQESVYKGEIDRLAAEYFGIELLEHALSENLASSFNKLRSISPEKLRMLVDIYSKRKDIENIKIVLRAKQVKSDEKEVSKLIQAAGVLDKSYFIELFRLNTIEDIIKKINILPLSALSEAYEQFEKDKSLAGIETAFDKYYYKQILKFTEMLPKEGKMFKDFLLNEIEIKNIMTLLRLLREGLGKEEISRYIISTYTSRPGIIANLIKSKNLDELLEMLNSSKYKDIIMDGVQKLKNENTLIDIEISLYNYLLRKSILMLHQHPLSVDVILGYMFAKEIEIRNLNLLTKGKQLGLTEDFIEKQLVMA